MNIDKLKAKALAEFDVWPYGSGYMVTPSEENVISSIKVGDMYLSHTSYVNNCWQLVYTREEFEADKVKQSKVYWNGEGVLPPVGEWFIDGSGDPILVECLLHHNSLAIYCAGGEEYFSVIGEMCKPVDNRTDKQKFIDEMMVEIDGVDYIDIRETLAKSYDKLVHKVSTSE